MPLSDITARQAKFTGKPQKLSDEKGLFLLVNQSGKYWRLKYRHGGKEKTLALGVYPEVSLKEARAKRDDARRVIAEGIDPGLVKKQSKIASKLATENNFEALAREWHQSQLALWSPGHATRVIESLEVDAFPDLGLVPVAELTAPMMLDALRKVEKRGATETAGRVLQRISAIMRYAIQTGRANYNPAQDLRGALKATKQEHRPALPRSELPEFFCRLEAEPLNPATRIAFHLLMLTMTRPGEVRFARWAEFDIERAEWRIPAERMKMRTEHLARQALTVSEQSEAEFYLPLCEAQQRLGDVVRQMAGGYLAQLEDKGLAAVEQGLDDALWPLANLVKVKGELQGQEVAKQWALEVLSRALDRSLVQATGEFRGDNAEAWAILTRRHGSAFPEIVQLGATPAGRFKLRQRQPQPL